MFIFFFFFFFVRELNRFSAFQHNSAEEKSNFLQRLQREPAFSANHLITPPSKDEEMTVCLPTVFLSATPKCNTSELDNPRGCQCLRPRGVLHYQLFFFQVCFAIFFPFLLFQHLSPHPSFFFTPFLGRPHQAPTTIVAPASTKQNTPHPPTFLTILPPFTL